MRQFTIEVLPKFPARVDAGVGMRIDKANGVYTFGSDFDTVGQVASPLDDPANTWVLVQLPDGSYAKMPVVDFPAPAGGVPFNPKDYGAKGDNVTDDTAAINAMFDAARLVCGAPFGPRDPVCITFPPGKYKASSINATLLTGYGSTIYGYGAEIIATTPGVAVFDLLGAELIHVYGLTIRANDSVNLARVGFQCGRYYTPSTAGGVCFTDCGAVGYFSLASFLNVGSEESQTEHCFWRNFATTANTWCMVEDGYNHWGVMSLYLTVTLPVDTYFGFVQSQHKNDLLMRTGGAGANAEVIWTCPGYDHIWEDCYIYTDGAARHVRIWMDSGVATFSQSFKWLRCQFEGATAVSQFVFDGNLSANPILSGFVLENNTGMATGQIFEWSGTGVITLLDAEIKQAAGFSSTPANGWFNDPAKFKLTGKAASRDATGKNSGFPRPFVGQFFAADAARIAYDTGTYDVYAALFANVANSRRITKGEQRWYGAAAAAYADNTLQSAPYVQLSGAGYEHSDAAGTQRMQTFRTGVQRRWISGVQNDAEGGANAGSSFAWVCYSDADTFIGTALQLVRATMAAIVGGALKVLGAIATPAGGTTGAGLTFGTSTNFGVFFGSGVPTLSAGKGSLYLRSDGTTTNDRFYINTNGGTTWTAGTTAA